MKPYCKRENETNDDVPPVKTTKENETNDEVPPVKTSKENETDDVSQENVPQDLGKCNQTPVNDSPVQSL